MRLSLITSACCLCLLMRFGAAQETPVERHRLATNQLKAAAAEVLARSLVTPPSPAEWERDRTRLRGELLEMLGLGSMPSRSPLRAKITGTVQREKYRIEKLVFESSPHLYVTGNFYLPTGAHQLPTVLYLCGHAPHPEGAKFNYQDRAAWFAANGYACLILDTLEFGEVAGLHHGLHDLNLWRWLSLGYTPAGVEVWNAIRALDYLETRPEVDMGRVGLTGISGGGAMTWYTAAVDERVRAAAPVCSTYTFGSQAQNWRAAGQCDCIYYHNTHGWDFPIVAALIAPRPLLIVSGRKDGDFPPDGYHLVFQRAKQVYDLQGAGEKIAEFDDEVGHSDPPQFLREARQWMQRWLKGDATPLPLETNPPPKETAADLACLRAVPLDAINDQIHDSFTKPVAPAKPKSRMAWRQRRAQALAQLNEKVFRWFPREAIPFETKISRNEGGWAARYANYKDVTFQTERGARVRAQLFTPKSGPAGKPLLIYSKRPGDSIYFLDFDELLPLFENHSVLVLNPRFTELSIPANEHRDIQMAAAWSGRTIAAIQLWDLGRAIEWVFSEEGLKPSTTALYGKGDMGLLGLYAALRDERVGQVILDDPPGSHWQGPALLNILRITDIAEIAGALAPRSLTALRSFPSSFELTRQIYRLEKASHQMTEAGSLRQALVAPGGRR